MPYTPYIYRTNQLPGHMMIGRAIDKTSDSAIIAVALRNSKLRVVPAG